MVPGRPAEREYRSFAILHETLGCEYRIHGGFDCLPGSRHEWNGYVECVTAQHGVDGFSGALLHATHAEHVSGGKVGVPRLFLPSFVGRHEKSNETRIVNAMN